VYCLLGSIIIFLKKYIYKLYFKKSFLKNLGLDNYIKPKPLGTIIYRPKYLESDNYSRPKSIGFVVNGRFKTLGSGMIIKPKAFELGMHTKTRTL
jgi:hypothetical protein